MENSSNEETGNTSYDYNYEYDEVCDKKNVARIGSIAVPLVFSLVVLLSLVGNILVLVVTLRKSYRSRNDTLICNLAISDLIFTAGLPFWCCQFIWGWTFGDVMCKGVSFVFSVGFYSSIVFLMMITLLRYIGIFHVSTQLPNCGTDIFLAWGLSIPLAVPVLFQSSVVSDTEDPNTLYCTHNSNEAKLAATNQQNIICMVAFSLIVFCYIRMYHKSINQSIDERSYRNIHRFLRPIICIGMVFFIAWAPYNILMFLKSRSYYHINYFTDCNVSDNLDYALYFCTMLAFSHCCLNPVLHTFTTLTFRNNLREILHRICSQIPAETQKPEDAIVQDHQEWMNCNTTPWTDTE